MKGDKVICIRGSGVFEVLLVFAFVPTVFGFLLFALDGFVFVHVILLSITFDWTIYSL